MNKEEFRKSADKMMVLDNMNRLGVHLSEGMVSLATGTNTPQKIHRFLQKKEYEPESILHPPENAKTAEKLHCVDGAFLGYTLGLLNGLDIRLVYLQGMADDDHMIVIFKEKDKYGAFSQSSNPLIVWREPEFNSITDLVTSFRRDYPKSNAPRFSDMVGYSEEIDEEFLRENIGFNWMTSMDIYKQIFHIVTNKLKYRLLKDIDAGVDRQFSHPLIIALQNEWIQMTADGDYELNTKKLPINAQILFNKFFRYSDKLRPKDDDTKARRIMWEFFNLTGTTPEDLKNMASYMKGWFQKDGFKLEQLLT